MEQKHYLIPYYIENNGQAYAYLFIKSETNPHNPNDATWFAGNCPNPFGGTQESTIANTLESELFQESHGKISKNLFDEWPTDDNIWNCQNLLLNEKNRSFYRARLREAMDENTMSSQVNEGKLTKLIKDQWCTLEESEVQKKLKDCKESTGKIIKINLHELSPLKFALVYDSGTDTPKINNIMKAIKKIDDPKNANSNLDNSVKSLLEILKYDKALLVDMQAEWITSSTVRALYKLKTTLERNQSQNTSSEEVTEPCAKKSRIG